MSKVVFPLAERVLSPFFRRERPLYFLVPIREMGDPCLFTLVPAHRLFGCCYAMRLLVFLFPPLVMSEGYPFDGRDPPFRGNSRSSAAWGGRGSAIEGIMSENFGAKVV